MIEDYYTSEVNTVYEPTNIYGEPQIGENVKIGAFCDIGPCVIGNNVTIAAFCFIPAGITIEDGAWIGPRVTFCNDRYPPSDKSAWEPTLVKKGAVIGGSVTVLPGVTIGTKARVGAGAVVTHNIPAYETWIGIPARKLIKE